MSADDSYPWEHFKVAGKPKDWEWNIAEQPGCPCNLKKGDPNKPRPHNCYSVYFNVTEPCTQGICRIGPGGALPYHSHEASEMYVPLKGSCTLYIDGQITTISGDTEGEAIYIPSNCPHGLKNETKKDYEFFWVYYSKNGDKSNADMQFQTFAEKAKYASRESLQNASTTRNRSRKVSVKVMFDKMSLSGEVFRKMSSSMNKLRKKSSVTGSEKIPEWSMGHKKSVSGTESPDSDKVQRKKSVSQAGSQAQISEAENGFSPMPLWMEKLAGRRKSTD